MNPSKSFGFSRGAVDDVERRDPALLFGDAVRARERETDDPRYRAECRPRMRRNRASTRPRGRTRSRRTDPGSRASTPFRSRAREERLQVDGRIGCLVTSAPLGPRRGCLRCVRRVASQETSSRRERSVVSARGGLGQLLHFDPPSGFFGRLVTSVTPRLVAVRNRKSAVLAEGSRGDPDARGRLTALVLRPVDHRG